MRRLAVKKRFSVEQIVTVLKQAELGLSVAELIRRSASPSRPFTDGRSSTPGWRRSRSGSSSSSRRRTPG
jgi:hypothetical protein